MAIPQQNLRETKAELASIFDNAPVMMILLDQEWRVRRANRAVAEATGLPVEQAVALPVGKALRCIHYLEDPRGCGFSPSCKECTLRLTVLNTFETGIAHHRAEVKLQVLRAVQPQQANLLVSTTLLALGGNQLVLACIEDISDLKRAEEALRLTEQQLRHAQKMEAVGRLAGGVAHDFNNLLTVIMGHCQLLLGHLDPADPSRAGIDEISKAGERAAALTSQLLALSRKQVLEPKALELNSLVDNMQGILQRLIRENIDLIFIGGASLGQVKADPGQIEQVILNLALNARDAMPDGGRLTIETANIYRDQQYARQHLDVQPGHYVTLIVSDTGCGMTPETLSRIFEPFFTTKDRNKGTGLGLATVYGIVKQSGGNIWVYSEPGHGTTFKIYLPRVEEADDPPPADTAQNESSGGSETILVVEDDEALRELIRAVCEARGYTVLAASNGNEALPICEKHVGPIHLMITDMVMPGMSGRELAQRLLPAHPQMKVLYMSGYPDHFVIHNGNLSPGAAFLQKPFTPAALSNKVRQLLGPAD